MIEDKPIPWQELFETFFRRWRLVLFGLVAGLLVGMSQVWLAPPVYRAQARIILTAEPVPGPREEAMPDRQIRAELAFLRSPALIRGVLEEHASEGDGFEPQNGPWSNLKRSVTQFFEGRYSQLHDVPRPSPRDRMVRAIAKRIEAEPVQSSNLVEVAFASSNPERAARFVNDLLEHHIRRIASLKEQPSTRDFIQGQLIKLSERWQEAQDALTEFREQNEDILLAGDENQLRAVLSRLESERVAAETQVLEFRARVNFLADEITRHPETIATESRVTENESVSFLNSRILELEIERSELLSRYTATSTPVQDLDRQIEEANRLLASKEGETLAETMTAVNPSYQTLAVDLVQSRAQLTSAETRVMALSTQSRSYREKLSQLERAAAEFQRLKNGVENSREAYQASARLQEEARYSSALGESRIVNVSLVDRAEVPQNPERSRAMLKIMVAALAGLLAAAGAAFIKDWMDPSVKSGAQAARIAGVQVIAELPSS